MRQLIDRLVSDRLVMAIIVLNATALVLHEMAPRGSSVRALWFWVDYVCVVFFLVEALIKIRRQGWPRYWASDWNKFDFTVVVVSLPALLGPFFDVSQFAFILILRLGRLFRLFRVLRFIPNLDHLVAALPDIGRMAVERHHLHASRGHLVVALPEGVDSVHPRTVVRQRDRILGVHPEDELDVVIDHRLGQGVSDRRNLGHQPVVMIARDRRHGQNDHQTDNSPTPH